MSQLSFSIFPQYVASSLFCFSFHKSHFPYFHKTSSKSLGQTSFIFSITSLHVHSNGSLNFNFSIIFQVSIHASIFIIVIQVSFSSLRNID